MVVAVAAQSCFAVTHSEALIKVEVEVEALKSLAASLEALEAAAAEASPTGSLAGLVQANENCRLVTVGLEARPSVEDVHPWSVDQAARRTMDLPPLAVVVIAAAAVVAEELVQAIAATVFAADSEGVVGSGTPAAVQCFALCWVVKEVKAGTILPWRRSGWAEKER